MPTATPALSAHGAAVQSILALCDGKRSVEEIEQRAYAQNRAYFQSPEKAAILVAEVLRAHAR